MWSPYKISTCDLFLAIRQGAMGVVLVLLMVFFPMISGLGVNWGTMASHRLDPEVVVKMLKDNGINKVKLFDADDWTVSATQGTNMELMLGIPNDMLQWIAKDYENAKEWVSENVTEYLNDGINIKYVAVGNEPFLTSYNGTNLKTTFPALKNIQKALNEAGHKTIKATVPHNSDVYESPSEKPSDGTFRPDINSLMVDMVKFLHQNNAPFVVNVYPFLSLHGNRHFPFDYAFCDSKGQTIQDKQYSYTNVFDANYDTLVWSLKKAQVPDLEIIVGEVGWPTDGDIYANVTLAKRFYDGFLKKIASKTGTPLRKGEIHFYLFGLFDEDVKSILPGVFERHWGIFRYDGKPKFAIDFSGKGASNKMPVGAKGVEYLDRQWCVYNPDQVADDKFEIGEFMSYACAGADCTAMMYGGSCNNLDLHGNYSYVFNQFYQLKNQEEKACNFDGYAHVVKQDPSKGTCVFPIQIAAQTISSRPTIIIQLLFLVGLFLQFF